jgi:hypothetical protein
VPLQQAVAREGEADGEQRQRGTQSKNESKE